MKKCGMCKSLLFHNGVYHCPRRKHVAPAHSACEGYVAIDAEERLVVNTSATSSPVGISLKPGQVWRHRNNNQYIIRAIANVESDNPDYPPTVLYEGMINGKLWARPLSRWANSFDLIE